MPKDRTKKRVARRTPSGRLSFHTRKKKTGRARCALCAAILRGVSAARGLSHTQRVPSRPFGGYLCPACLGEAVALAARVMNKELKLSDVDARWRPFVESIL